jgi:hypothetical protein
MIPCSQEWLEHLPDTEDEIQARLEGLQDLIDGNVRPSELSLWRELGVRIGHS